MAHSEAPHPIEIDWNGRDVPSELAHLPPGRYRVEPADEWDLPLAEEAKLEEAAGSLDRGEGVPAEAAAERLRQRLAGRGGH